MDEHDDLDALRRADPVDPASLPSARGLEGHALFERITMADTTDTTTETTTDPLTAAPPPRPPRRRWAIAAVAAAVVIVGAIVGLAAGGDDDADDVAQPPPTSTEPISPGGQSSQMCVEVYDLATIANREMAFDGNVIAVNGDEVTFEVNQWFGGGTADETTVGGAGGLGTLTSVGEAFALEPGTRLLVAGDQQFAWSCGFTQPYDPDVAADWERAFAA